MKLKPVISIFLLTLIFSCTNGNNSVEHSKELNEKPYNVPEIEEVSNSITPFELECKKYFQDMFIEADIWDSTAFIKEFVSFEPKTIVDNTLFDHSKSDGIYIYTIRGVIKDNDTSSWSQASYFNNEEQILIPVHIANKKVVFDTLMEIYLPFRDVKMNCLNLNTDTVPERSEGNYGLWKRVDEDHKPL